MTAVCNKKFKLYNSNKDNETDYSLRHENVMPRTRTLLATLPNACPIADIMCSEGVHNVATTLDEG